MPLISCTTIYIYCQVPNDLKLDLLRMMDDNTEDHAILTSTVFESAVHAIDSVLAKVIMISNSSYNAYELICLSTYIILV